MNIKRVRESFTFDENGRPVSFSAGDLVDVDTIGGYKGREHLFEEVSIYVGRKIGSKTKVVESATSDPGERKSITSAIGRK
jgi:hypothetical protein